MISQQRLFTGHLWDLLMGAMRHRGEIDDAACGNHSRAHPYSPRWLPPGLGLLRRPRPLPQPPLLPEYLPVLREEDHETQSTFYYYAHGCSDLYIRSGRSIVANNRVDALVRLSESLEESVRRLSAACPWHVKRTNWPPKDVLRALANATPEVAVPPRVAEVSGSGCLNALLARTMSSLGVDTLVLNFEPPGVFHARTKAWERKTEIMRLRPGQLYDEHGRACEPLGVGCLHCNASFTPRARQACSRWMLKYGENARDWRAGYTPAWKAMLAQAQAARARAARAVTTTKSSPATG